MIRIDPILSDPICIDAICIDTIRIDTIGTAICGPDFSSTIQQPGSTP